MTEKQFLPSGHRKISQLEMINITKRFPGVIANDKINFDMHAGEVHALLGENGAGKSTLMKILYGLYQPDEGQIKLNGEQLKIGSPVDSIKLGIGMIHQHFMLVESLTVTENVALGLPSSRGLLTDLDKVSARILELAEIYRLQVDPDAYVWQLEPRLGPRWLMYFFLTAAGTGFALPIVYIFQRRMAKARVPASVLVRESILFAVFLDLVLWMQIGRILSNLIIFFLACGFVLLEIFLRVAEKATFDASES